MKRVFKLFLITLLLVILTSCKYTSSYKAVGLIRTTKENYCYAKFHKLDGTLIFKVRNTQEDEGNIRYYGKLEEGEINVYYDSLGIKELLFTVKAGEEIESKGGYIEEDRNIYIIIETVEPSKGKIEINFE